ncbi:MAG: hypothetical protein ACP5U2_02150 [Bryobacteraceae bacterium]
MRERPSEAEIREHLERVLSSAAFGRAERASRLLRYSVEKTLDGQVEQFKESVLAIEVFERTASFDPLTDTIVRVQARRLRKSFKNITKQMGVTTWPVYFLA